MSSRLRTLPLAAALVVAAAVLWARPAAAQYPPPPPPPPPPGYAPAYAPPPPPYSPPRMMGALRIGYSMPSGTAFGNVGEHELFGDQVEIQGEFGLRVNPHLTLGGYLGGAFGNSGDYYRSWCGDYHCGAYSFRTGFMAQLNFAPLAPVNPWIGYGFGFVANVVDGDEHNYGFSHSYVGFDLAHFMAGIDLRPSGGFGIGLFVDYTMTMYTWYSWDAYDVTIADGGLTESIHHWVTFGPRITF